VWRGRRTGAADPPVTGPGSGAVFDLHLAATGRYQDHTMRLVSRTGLDPQYRVPGLLLPALAARR
jgi:hypothetical protein